MNRPRVQVAMSDIIRKVEQDCQGDELGARPKTMPVHQQMTHVAPHEIELEHRGETDTPDTVLCKLSAPANSSESEGEEGCPWHNLRDLADYEYEGIELQRDLYAYEKWVEKKKQKNERRARKQQKKDATDKIK